MEKISSVENTQRYVYIDFLKVIAIFLVITLHTGLWYPNFLANRSSSNIIQFFFRIIAEGVPVFVMINGFLLLPKGFEMEKHLKKMKKIFILIIFWASVMTLLKSFIAGIPVNIDLLIKNVLTTPNRNTGGLWFLQSLLALYFVFPILKKAYDSALDDNAFDYYKYIFVLTLFFTVGINLIKVLIDLLMLNNKNMTLIKDVMPFIYRFNPLANGYFILFFMIGGFIKKQFLFFEKNKWQFFFFGMISQLVPFYWGYRVSVTKNQLISTSYNYSTIFMPILLIALFCLSLIYDNKRIFPNVISSISKNVFGIFFVHGIIIDFLRHIYPFNENYFYIRLFFTCIVFIVSYLISVVLQHIPRIRWIVNL